MTCQVFYFLLQAVSYNQIMEFSEWLTQKYIEWRGDAIGNNRSISDFAQMVGVSQPTMSFWMKRGGKIPRAKDSIQHLVNAFGFEVYDVLGLPKPGSENYIGQLPLPFRERLESALSEINETYQVEGIDTANDPRGERASCIAESIFAKYGISISVTSIEDDPD
jgi:hypothetical protein